MGLLDGGRFVFCFHAHSCASLAVKLVVCRDHASGREVPAAGLCVPVPCPGQHQGCDAMRTNRRCLPERPPPVPSAAQTLTGACCLQPAGCRTPVLTRSSGVPGW